MCHTDRSLDIIFTTAGNKILAMVSKLIVRKEGGLGNLIASSFQENAKKGDDGLQ